MEVGGGSKNSWSHLQDKQIQPSSIQTIGISLEMENPAEALLSAQVTSPNTTQYTACFVY